MTRFVLSLAGALLGVTTLGAVPLAAQQGQCRDAWVTQAVREVTGRAPNGSGDSGECNFRNYGGGQWSSYPDLVNKVRAHFASATPTATAAAQGQCRDPWVAQAVREVTGRAPNGSGDSGECNFRNYGGGQWSSYADLVNKVRLALASSSRPAPVAQPAPTPSAGRAYTMALGTAGKKCLIPAGDHDGAEILIRPCAEGGAIYLIKNGYVMTAGGRCLDWSNQGGPIHLAPCKPGTPDRTSQQWYFHGNKLAQNALHDNICMDIEGGVNGRRALAWSCHNYGSPAENQKFYPGGSFPLLELAGVLGNYVRDVQQGKYVEFSGGSYVVAAGGGNVVAAGGANVVAAGGANVVAAGGANVVAAGGLNLRVVTDATHLFQGARVVAAGGLN